MTDQVYFETEAKEGFNLIAGGYDQIQFISEGKVILRISKKHLYVNEVKKIFAETEKLYELLNKAIFMEEK